MSIEDDARRQADKIEKERQRFLERAERKTRVKKNGGGSSGPPISTDDWRNKLRKTYNNRGILGDMKNAEIAFENAPELCGLVKGNELSRRIELQRRPPWWTVNRSMDWCDEDDVALACWLQAQGIPIHSDATVSRVVRMMAARNSYHPVRDWLRMLTWDKEPRIKEVLIEVLGATGNGTYLGAVLVAWMVSAVARVMQPGCKADHMLVLIGGERAGKSSFAQMLGGPWYCESNSTFGTKDSIAELEGAWIIEVGELAALHRARWEIINQFLSRQVDHYRPAYGRAVIDQLRSCVFIGTTNEEKFLRSPYGNRRSWPVRCGRIDLSLLRASRLQLWAEAVALYDDGQQWHLTSDEEKLAATVQEDHRIVSEVEEDVRLYLQRCLDAKPEAKTSTTISDVYDSIAGEHERHNLSARRQVETAIGQAMRRAGWVCVGRKGEWRRTTYTYQGLNLDN